jgi:two-component system response regulator HydG
MNLKESNMPHILIIDDDPDICLLLDNYFSKKGFDVQTASNGNSAIEILKKSSVEVVLCDFKLPDYTGIEILQKIKIINPLTQVIIITGYSDVRVAVEALKKGAFEYVTKPLYPDEILMTVKSALKSKNLPKDHRKASRKSKSKKAEYINGVSQQAQTVEKHVELIAPTDMSVIIMGETGTGKEYVARAIHEKSKRKANSFLAIDCGALPKELAGSELFGHVKGAFTGAVSDKKGCFELANGGTLFLDEIGNLSFANQMKLLRVLQEKVVKKIGGTQDIPVDVRIIVATNEDLVQEVKSGNFREDIYHRINEFKIELVPIRERPDDIAVFSEYFLNEANIELEKTVAGFDDHVMNNLKGHYWHGNLRELRNVIRRSVLLCQGDKIKMEHLPQEFTVPVHMGKDGFQVSFNGAIPGSLKEVAEQAEKKAILEVLRQTNNNKSKTAELLKVDRKTLYNKLKSYKIEI